MLQKILEEYPVAQQRTSVGKQFVIYYNDVVLKGTYKKERLDRILDRIEYFIKNKVINVILPTEIKEIDGMQFLQFPNLEPDYARLETKEKEESFSKYKYKYIVSKDRNLVTFADFLEGKYDKEWLSKSIPDLIATYLHLYSLNVGDVNIRNTLVDLSEKKFYIVDYDEVRKSNNDGEFFYFNRNPGKKWNLHELFRPYYKFVDHPLGEKLIGYCTEKVEEKKEIEVNVEVEVNDKKKEIEVDGFIIKGPYYAKGPSGYTTDILKSGVQKYVRRGILNKALYCAHELFLFGNYENGKRFQTNLYNRLAIISCEDISPSEAGLILAVLKVSNEAKKYRNLEIMLSVVSLLVDSKKSRIGSHVWNAYAKEENWESSINAGIDMYIPECELLESDIKSEDPSVMEERKYLSYFYYFLKNRNRNCFCWLSALLPFLKSRGSSDKKKSDVVWNLINEFIKGEPYKILKTAFDRLGEKRPIIVMAVLFVLHDIKLDILDLKSTLDDVRESKLIEVLEGGYKLEIDEYVIDKHTSKGRSKGLGRAEFVKEGAIIFGEDEKYKDEILEKLYLN